MIARDAARILIVDDEKPAATLLCDVLTEAGFVCSTAVSSEEALEKLHLDYYDLVLADIVMHGMDGLGLLEQVAATGRDIPVVMITGRFSLDNAVAALRGGAMDYILKPFKVEDVEASVRRALQKRALMRRQRDLHRNLEARLRERTTKLITLMQNTLHALAMAIEERDRYTRGHSGRVAEYGVLTARRFGFAGRKVESLRTAGVLHDIGKIGVEEKILSKSGTLTPEEYEKIKQHPDAGVRILSPLGLPLEVLQSVQHHHERWDGKGYPGGLDGRQIPLGARILAVADAYDAIVSARPYRPSRSDEEARAALTAGKGTQFDPEAVDAFLENVSPSVLTQEMPEARFNIADILV